MTSTGKTTSNRPWWQRLLGLGQRGRKLTPAEIAELKAEREERKRLDRLSHELKAEAIQYAAAIPTTLAQIDVCYRVKKSEGGLERVQRVKLRKPYYVNEERIYFKIDTRPGQLPRGVGIEELEHPDVLKNLSVACRRNVSFAYREQTGAWFVVDRKEGMGGLPRHVDYASFLASRPASASGLTLPLGVALGKKNVWKSIGDMPHLLVGGTTGSGKSNFINATLCTLLRHNSPRRLRLLLIDLKSGVELGLYRNVPHVWTITGDDGTERKGIVEDRSEVVEWLTRVLNEGERRLKLLKENELKNIGAFNSRNPGHAWPHILVVFDELADLKLLPQVERSKADEIILSVAARFRACGIHLALSTQTPSKEIIPLRMRTLLPARLAFSCPNASGSISIIGSGQAVGLEVGRAILDWGRSKTELQTPRINDGMIGEIVAQACAGKFEEIEASEHDVTEEEIFSWCVDQNLGYLSYRDVLAEFRGRGMSQDWAFDFCRRAEGRIVLVGSSSYEVMAGGPRVPRRLLPVAEPDPDRASPEMPSAAPDQLASSDDGHVPPAKPDDAGQPPAPAPAKRKRGRPYGSKNKPKPAKPPTA